MRARVPYKLGAPGGTIDLTFSERVIGVVADLIR